MLYEVDVDGYVFIVPVVRDGNGLFLKTIYPSRKTAGMIRFEKVEAETE